MSEIDDLINDALNTEKPEEKEVNEIDSLIDSALDGTLEQTNENAEQTQEEEGKGFLGAVAEVPLNLLGGIGSFLKETTGTVLDWPAELLENNLGSYVRYDTSTASPKELKLWNDVSGTRLFANGSVEHAWVSGEGIRKLKENNFYNAWKAEKFVEKYVYDLSDVKESGMQETFVGGATGGITQFLSGWIALAPVKLLSVAKNAPVIFQMGQATIKGAVVDFTAFDAHEARLSDMLKEFNLENDFINYLASDADDTIFEGKLKNSIEGGVIGIVAESTIRAVINGVRAVRAYKRSKDPNLSTVEREKNANEAIELQNKIQENFKDPSEVDFKTDDGTTIKVETQDSVAKDFEEATARTDETPEPKADETPEPKADETPISDRVDDEVDVTKLSKDELDLLTKKERAELGSLRSPDDVGKPKVIPIKQTIADGNRMIANLLRGAKDSDILTFVRKLKVTPILRIQNAQWLTGIRTLKEDVAVALKIVQDSAAYKAKDKDALLKEKQLTEAYFELHAIYKGDGSSIGRALQTLKETIFSSDRDLSSYFGEDLARAKEKELKKVTKEVEKVKKKRKKTAKEMEDAAYDGGLKPEDTTTPNPITVRLVGKIKKGYQAGKGLSDKAVEYMAANLLWGLDTQAINIVANAVQKMLGDFETMGGGFIAKTRQGLHTIIGRSEDATNASLASKRQIRRAKYQLASTIRATNAAFRAAFETFATGYNKLDPDYKVKEEVEGAVDQVSIGSRDFDLRTLLPKKVREDYKKWLDSQDNIEDLTFEDYLGNFLRVPFRGLAAGDEFFKQLNFRGIYGALVNERYITQGKNLDLTDVEYLKLIDIEIDNGIELLHKFRKGEDVLTEAEEKALGEVLYSIQKTREATFTDKLGGIGQWFQKGMNEYPIMRLVTQAWYIRTPTNIFKFSARRTPLINLASRRFREAMKRGGDDRDRAIFEMLYMSSAWYAIYNYLVEDTVEIPDNEGGSITMYRYQGTYDSKTFNNVKNLKLAGVDRHSYYDESSKKFKNTQRYDPFDTMLMTMVNVRELRDSGKYAEADELAAAMLISWINLAQDKTFTQGIATFADTLANPERSFETFIEGYTRAATPAFIKVLENDDVKREVNGMREAFIASSPWSDTLDPEFDLLGQPKIKDDRNNWDLAKHSLLRDEKVRLEFIKMRKSNIPEPAKIEGLLDWTGGEDGLYTKDGKSAWVRFNELYGGYTGELIDGIDKTLEEALIELINSNEYQELTLESSSTPWKDFKGGAEIQISKVLKLYEKAAKMQVLEEYKDTGIMEVWKASQLASKQNRFIETQEDVQTDASQIVKDFLTNN